MANLLLLLLSGLFALGSPQNISPASTSDFSVPNVCLTDTAVSNGISPGTVSVPNVLSGIKKANTGNTTPGYEIPRCQNSGGCEGPDVADYKLVATNVKVDHVVFPNSYFSDMNTSDRQLVQQLDVSDDPVLKDRYRNRIYRTFCGDWCHTCSTQDIQCDAEGLTCTCSTLNPPVVLPYKGSFHCNFIFYLQDTDGDGNLQIDEDGNLTSDHQNPKDARLPTDGSLFSVYFRVGAQLPPSLRCAPTPTEEVKRESDLADLIRPKQVYAESSPVPTPTSSPLSNIVEYPPKSSVYWLIESNRNSLDGSFKARNTQVNWSLAKKYIANADGSNIAQNPFGLKANYEVYKNLLDPEGDFYIYFTSPGTIDQMKALLNRGNIGVAKFTYFRLIALDITKPGQRTLKLGQFIPPNKSWIRGWVEESKPAIYLYPPLPQELSVRLGTKGFLTVSDPPYDNVKGWRVKAYPNGTIVVAGHKYPYLYYEARLQSLTLENNGFIVPKTELKKFLIGKLSRLGLNNHETDDFLDYWLPRLQGSTKPYYFIRFLGKDEIDTQEPIYLSAEADTSIRIRPYFLPVDAPFQATEQKLSSPPARRGFTLVEWGGILDQ